LPGKKVQKQFRLSAAQIKPLVTGKGSCYASDRITVDGCPVGFMYREPPDDDASHPDSGWRFLAGDESQDYVDNADNFAIYDVNTIANYDRKIIPLLDAPFFSAFERNRDTDNFERAPFPADSLTD
jgi:hypothetical protein